MAIEPKKPENTVAMKKMYENIERVLRSSKKYDLCLYFNALESITATIIDGNGNNLELVDNFSVGEAMDALERKLEEKAGMLPGIEKI